MLHALRNHLPNFAGRVVPGTRNDLPQLPEMVSRGKEMMGIFLDRVEPHMAKNAFVAGPDFSIADITAYFTVRMTVPFEMDLSKSHRAIAAWYDKLAVRPAFQL